MHPTLVVEPGVEEYVDEDGQVARRYLAPAHSADVAVGQLGFYIPLPRKKSLFPGLTTTRDCKRLQTATNGDVYAKVEGMEVECPPTTFGDRLRRAMLTRRIDAKSLASESSVNISHVHRLLRCEDARPKRMKTDTIIALSRALDVDGWWLQTGEGEPPHGTDPSKDHQG